MVPPHPIDAPNQRFIVKLKVSVPMLKNTTDKGDSLMKFLKTLFTLATVMGALSFGFSELKAQISCEDLGIDHCDSADGSSD